MNITSHLVGWFEIRHSDSQVQVWFQHHQSCRRCNCPSNGNEASAFSPVKHHVLDSSPVSWPTGPQGRRGAELSFLSRRGNGSGHDDRKLQVSEMSSRVKSHLMTLSTSPMTVNQIHYLRTEDISLEASLVMKYPIRIAP